jgi:hypothetical protein
MLLESGGIIELRECALKNKNKKGRIILPFDEKKN